MEVLLNDREYLILEGLIKSLRDGKFYDKSKLADVLQSYQLWVLSIITKALNVAEVADLNEQIHKWRYDDLVHLLKTTGLYEKLKKEVSNAGKTYSQKNKGSFRK